MRNLVAAALLGACGACIRGSNLPDGGQCPAVAGDAGSAQLAGPLAFTVVSAEEADVVQPVFYLDGGYRDGGVIQETGVANLSIVLSAATSSYCETVAGYCPSTALVANLVNPPVAGTWTGSYDLGASGSATGLSEWVAYDDGGGQAYLAASGQLRITSTAACSLVGSFSASMLPYGQTDGGSTLSGMFQAVYNPN